MLMLYLYITSMIGIGLSMLGVWAFYLGFSSGRGLPLDTCYLRSASRATDPGEPGVALERTLIVVKPDGVRRGLVGEVISRFERKGFKIVALKMVKLSREEAEEFYSVHRDKPFFDDLVSFITSGPVVAMVIEGDSAIEVARLMIGATDGRKAAPGTIRGDFSLDIMMNIVHASDSRESFEREFRVVFKDDELVEW